MIPKERAIELFDEFDSILFKEYNNLEAKKCALIAVDKIIKAVESDWSFMEARQEYWKEVKQEINLL